jgi:hypothetical protein
LLEGGLAHGTADFLEDVRPAGFAGVLYCVGDALQAVGLTALAARVG